MTRTVTIDADRYEAERRERDDLLARIAELERENAVLRSRLTTAHVELDNWRRSGE